MNSLLAGLIVLITYGSWGLWLVKRRWQFEDDLDSGFFLEHNPSCFIDLVSTVFGTS